MTVVLVRKAVGSECRRECLLTPGRGGSIAAFDCPTVCGDVASELPAVQVVQEARRIWRRLVKLGHSYYQVPSVPAHGLPQPSDHSGLLACICTRGCRLPLNCSSALIRLDPQGISPPSRTPIPVTQHSQPVRLRRKPALPSRSLRIRTAHLPLRCCCAALRCVATGWTKWRIWLRAWLHSRHAFSHRRHLPSASAPSRALPHDRPSNVHTCRAGPFATTSSFLRRRGGQGDAIKNDQRTQAVAPVDG